MGSVFIYILVATIGMSMNVREVFENPGLFGVGLVWMIISRRSYVPRGKNY